MGELNYLNFEPKRYMLTRLVAGIQRRVFRLERCLVKYGLEVDRAQNQYMFLLKYKNYPCIRTKSLNLHQHIQLLLQNWNSHRVVARYSKSLSLL